MLAECQCARVVDTDGRPVVERTRMGDPSVSTTGSLDGENPPSCEDWNNDYIGDDPGLPA